MTGTDDAFREALSRIALLTIRETEVFELLGKGRSCPEIATLLGRTRRTVETHVRNIGGKLGIRGVQRLTLLASMHRERPAPQSAAGDQAIMEGLRRVVTHQKRARAALDALAAATSTLAGERFIDALAAGLCRALEVRAAAVLEFGDDGRTVVAATRAVGGSLRPPLPAPFATETLDPTTPSGFRVLSSADLAHDPRHPLRGLLHATHGLSLGLTDDQDRMIGGIVLLNDRELDDQLAPLSILRLVGGRVAAELALRRAARSLRESESRYRLLAEQSSDLIARFSPKGIHEYVSPSYQTQLGWAPEELLGRSAYEFIHTDDIARVGPVHSAALTDTDPRRVRVRIRRRDGSFVWMESIVRGVVNPATGLIEEIIAATRDVSVEEEARQALATANAELESRVAERTRELARQEERWRSTVQQSFDYITLIDRDLRFVYCNRVEPPWTEAEMHGARALDAVLPEDRPIAEAAMRRTLTTGETSTAEVRCPLANGLRLFSVGYSPVLVDGAIIAIASWARDVTDQRAMEAALKASEVRYRQLVELAPDGILVHDGTTVHFANAAFAELLGLPDAAALVGRPVLELVCEELRPAVAERIAELLRQRGRSPAMRQRLVRIDGRFVEVMTSATWCEWDGRDGVQVLVRADGPPDSAIVHG